MRKLPEWIGKTADTPVPAHVRVRIFDAHNGICHIANRKIKRGEPWDLDHIKALCNGGENRESNMAPALRDKHRQKTAEDVAEKSRVYRKRAKHLGVLPKRAKIQSAGFRPAAPQRSASRPIQRKSEVFRAGDTMGGAVVTSIINYPKG